MKTPFYALLLLVLLNVSFTAAHGADELLLVKPSKCVALRKGQVCYQKVTVSFADVKRGDYCLYLDNDDKPLKCWTKTSNEVLSFAFESAESLRLSLLNGAGVLIASSTITVAWVYTKRSRRQNVWRLF